MQKKTAAELQQRYFGLVIDNFTCNDEMMTKSLPILMGKYLFYHIVDTPHTASQIICELNATGLSGEVNFFALSIIDRFKFNQNDYTSCISFDTKFQNIFEMIFTEMPLNFKDFENKLRNGFDVDTLFPDVIKKNGALITIHLDTNQNPIELYQQEKNLLDLEETTHYQLKETAWQMESTIYHLNETTELLNQQNETVTSVQHVQSALSQTNHLIQLCESNIATKQNDVENHENKIKELTDTINRYENELKLELLNDQETKTIERIQVLIIDKKMKLQQINAEMQELHTKRDNVVNFLEQSLMSRYSILAERSQSHSNNMIKLSQKEHEMIQTMENQAKCVVHLDQIRHQMVELTNELENRKLVLKTIEQQKYDAQENQKSLFSELEMIELHQKNLISDLNRLLAIKPYDATEFYNPDIAEMSESDIVNQLNIAHHQLQTYQSTNNFDVHILDTFKKDRENFMQRRAELTKIGTKISMLMENLNASISTSIRNTFDELANEFKIIFKKFVENGSARLQLIETNQCDATTQINNDSISQIDGTEKENKITAIEIFARFNDIEKVFDDLMGQERRVVSLALIISMQRLCPAPFYLFDCIDEVNNTHFFFLKFIPQNFYDNKSILLFYFVSFL